MDDRSEVESYVDSLAPIIKENVDVLTPEEIPGGCLYHIGVDGNIDSFEPRVPRRAADMEDVTVPRVCVANTVLGCFIGHNACIDDFFDEKNNNGGWYVYKFDFDFALFPNNNLAGDSSRSGEHWLVPYKKERWEYKAKVIGKVFFSSIRYFRVPESRTVTGIVEAYVEVYPDETIHWSKAVLLTEGHYRIEMDIPTSSCRASWRKHKHYEVREISRGEFMDRKKIAASLLSHEEVGEDTLLPGVGDLIVVEDDCCGDADNGPWTKEVAEIIPIRSSKSMCFKMDGDDRDCYTIPKDAFYKTTVTEEGRRVCFAKAPIVSKESLPPSFNW